jgi:hypothetical protein
MRAWGRWVVVVAAILLGAVWILAGGRLLRGLEPGNPERLSRALRDRAGSDHPVPSELFDGLARGFTRTTRAAKAKLLPVYVAKGVLGALFVAGALGLALEMPPRWPG